VEYLRVSTKSQLDNGMEIQRNKNHAMVEQLRTSGVEVQLVGTYFEGKSAFRYEARDRKAVQDLCEAARNDQFDAIIFYEESRLSRGIIDWYRDVFIPINDINKRIRYFKSMTGEEWFPNQAESMQNWINAFNESQKKSEIAKDVQENMLNHHQRPGARSPFGVSAITQDYIALDVKFPIVVFIFVLASRGYSERDISETLTQMGLANINGHTSVHHILHNEIYIGKGTWNRRLSKRNSSPSPKGSQVYVQYPELIPQKLWDLAHAALEIKQNRSYGSNKNGFLLRGLLRCAQCSEVMDAKNRTKYRNGIVSTRTKSGEPLRYYFCTKCGTKYDAPTIEGLVIHQVSNEFSSHFNESHLNVIINKMIKTFKIHAEDLDNKLEDIRFKLCGSPNLDTKENYQMINQILKQVENDISKTREELLGLHYQFNNLVHSGAINELYDVITTSPLDNLGKIELRHLLHMTISSIQVRMTTDGQVKVGLDYRNIPMPNVEMKFEELIGRVNDMMRN
jgi:hypothetical protein